MLGTNESTESTAESTKYKYICCKKIFSSIFKYWKKKRENVSRIVHDYLRYEQRLQRPARNRSYISTINHKIIVVGKIINYLTIVCVRTQRISKCPYIIHMARHGESSPTREVAYGFLGFRIKTIKRVARESDLVFSVMCLPLNSYYFIIIVINIIIFFFGITLMLLLYYYCCCCY